MTVYLGAAERQATIKKRKVSKNKGEYQFTRVFYVLLSIVIFLGLSYGLVANKAAITGYDIKTLEKTLNDTKDKNDDLKIKISELKSVKVLEEKITEMGMIEPSEVEYMSVSNSFALR